MNGTEAVKERQYTMNAVDWLDVDDVFDWCYMDGVRGNKEQDDEREMDACEM